MQTLADLPNTIPASIPLPCRAQRHIDGLLKPVGSPGRLEALAIQLAGMPGLNGTAWAKKRYWLCADHGVWEEGRYFPKEVTAIQAEKYDPRTTGVCAGRTSALTSTY